MLYSNILIALWANSILALPLNINLGAYSPALVVGDGEISFGNAERAGQVMETLASGAAVAGNAGNGQAQGQQQGAPPPAEGAAPPPPAPEGGAPPPEGDAAPAGEPRIRYHVTPASEPIAKREEHSEKTKREEVNVAAPRSSKLIARDINGFREALNYAREAMKNTPKLEIGSENAGVGIIQNAGTNVQANSAANGQLPAGQVAKRDESQPETGKTGITLLAIAEV